MANPNTNPSTGTHAQNPATLHEAGQRQDMAFFRADLALSSPESYTLEEKRQICNDMITSTQDVCAAMRRDFESMAPEHRAMLLDMLCQDGTMDPQWWWDVLVGDGDPVYKDLQTI